MLFPLPGLLFLIMFLQGSPVSLHSSGLSSSSEKLFDVSSYPLPSYLIPFLQNYLRNWMCESIQNGVYAYSVAKSCPALWDPMDCSPPDSSVHGILQARILKWVAISFSKDLPNPGFELRSPALTVDSLLHSKVHITWNLEISDIKFIHIIVHLSLDIPQWLLLCHNYRKHGCTNLSSRPYF